MNGSGAIFWEIYPFEKGRIRERSKNTDTWNRYYSLAVKIPQKNCVSRHLSSVKVEEMGSSNPNNHIFRLLYDYPPSSKSLEETDLSIPLTRCSIELPRSNKREQCARDRCTDRDVIFAIGARHSSWERWFDDRFFFLVFPSSSLHPRVPETK